MSYKISRTNGEFFADIADSISFGPKQNKRVLTPLNLIGQKQIRYGEQQNENYLWLTENYASHETLLANFKGQLWFRPDTKSSGQLLVSPKDNCKIDEWITVPVLSRVDLEPLISESYPGRLIIKGSGDIRVALDDAWVTLPIAAKAESSTALLLDINYNSTAVVDNPAYNGNGEYSLLVNAIQHESSKFTDIARFNLGGKFDSNRSRMVNGDDSVFRFGGVYKWDAYLTARSITDPSMFKTWYYNGSVSVMDRTEQQTFIDAVIDDRTIWPGVNVTTTDPRILAEAFGELLPDPPEHLVPPAPITDPSKSRLVVLEQRLGSEAWGVSVRAGTEFPFWADLANINIDLPNGPYFGLVFTGTSGTTAQQLQWNIQFNITGLPESNTAN